MFSSLPYERLRNFYYVMFFFWLKDNYGLNFIKFFYVFIRVIFRDSKQNRSFINKNIDLEQVVFNLFLQKDFFIFEFFSKI